MHVTCCDACSLQLHGSRRCYVSCLCYDKPLRAVLAKDVLPRRSRHSVCHYCEARKVKRERRTFLCQGRSTLSYRCEY